MSLTGYPDAPAGTGRGVDRRHRGGALPRHRRHGRPERSPRVRSRRRWSTSRCSTASSPSSRTRSPRTSSPARRRDRLGTRHPNIAPFQAFEAGDGRLFVVCAGHDDAVRARCAPSIGRPELARGRRASSSPDAPTPARRRARGAARAAAPHPSRGRVARRARARRQVPCAPGQHGRRRRRASPQVAARHMVVDSRRPRDRAPRGRRATRSRSTTSRSAAAPPAARPRRRPRRRSSPGWISPRGRPDPASTRAASGPHPPGPCRSNRPSA